MKLAIGIAVLCLGLPSGVLAQGCPANPYLKAGEACPSEPPAAAPVVPPAAVPQASAAQQIASPSHLRLQPSAPPVCGTIQYDWFAPNNIRINGGSIITIGCNEKGEPITATTRSSKIGKGEITALDIGVYEVTFKATFAAGAKSVGRFSRDGMKFPGGGSVSDGAGGAIGLSYENIKFLPDRQ